MFYIHKYNYMFRDSITVSKSSRCFFSIFFNSNILVVCQFQLISAEGRTIRTFHTIVSTISGVFTFPFCGVLGGGGLRPGSAPCVRLSLFIIVFLLYYIENDLTRKETRCRNLSRIFSFLVLELRQKHCAGY
jgi:hypothetical protein